MIRGWFPLVCLWITTAGCWTSFGLVLATPWRRTLVGRLLAGYTAAHAVWWTLILVGSYAGVPRPLQLAEATAFALLPVAVLWMVALQARARWCPHVGGDWEDDPGRPDRR